MRDARGLPTSDFGPWLVLGWTRRKSFNIYDGLCLLIHYFVQQSIWLSRELLVHISFIDPVRRGTSDRMLVFTRASQKWLAVGSSGPHCYTDVSYRCNVAALSLAHDIRKITNTDS